MIIPGSIDAAFREFRTRIGARAAFLSSSDSLPSLARTTGPTGDVTESLSIRGAGLRLVYRACSSELCVEISHGPPAGAIAGWLDLFSAKVIDGELQSDEPDPSLDSTIEYALDLMLPLPPRT